MTVARQASDRRPRGQQAGAPRPRLRLRLGTVLVFVSLVVLLLPAVGVYALRQHENTLVRQGESDLARAADVVAASYRAMFEKSATADLAASGLPLAQATPLSWPSLDLGDGAIGPPFPPARPAAAVADAVAQQIGAEMASVLRQASNAVGASVRLLDWRGTVVATTVGDMGGSLAHVEEIQRALAGTGVASLRRAAGERSPVLTAIVRGAALQMVVAVPVVSRGFLVGIVVLSRQPPDILDSLIDKRFLLVQSAALFFVVAVAIAIVMLRTLVLPIKRLSVAARRVSSGDTDRFDRGRAFRVREVAGLADSIEVMVENLQRRNRYIRDLAYSISHEFKTPIAAAQGAAELLSDNGDELKPQEVRHFAANIAADMRRLDRLTQRLLALAQAEVATVDDRKTDVVAAANAIDCSAVHVANDAEILAHIAPESLQATLDILVNNALEGGAQRIDIHAASDDANVELWVSDDGAGIAAGDRARIFDPFYTTRRDRGGTGLGLTICRAFVDGSGGSIELMPSERGATFKLTLRK